MHTESPHLCELEEKKIYEVQDQIQIFRIFR
jgi:hypothetical protein